MIFCQPGTLFGVRRIAVITGSRQSSWTSCQSITRNLGLAYAQGFEGAELRNFSIGATTFEGHQLADALAAWKPDLIAWTEHKPHPGAFLRAVIERGLEAQIAIHVYGDFALQALEWLSLEDVLPKLKLRFICASERQRQLVAQFISGQEQATVHIPFPVDNAAFQFSSTRAESIRQKMGLRSNDVAFLYTGRLSLQKNVTGLLNSFASYLEEIDSHAQLWLAGRPDDLGVPYLGVDVIPGWYTLQLQELIDQRIPETRRRQIRYFGELAPEALRDLHLASSCFVSLSTHNDEDFGMAPAEALLCGSPLLLTDWGGYSSFLPVAPEHCSLVPVEIRNEAVLPQPKAVLQAMVLRSLRLPTLEDRAQIARAGAAFCSIPAVAGRLVTELRTDSAGLIQGWTPLFQNLAQSFRMGPGNPFRSTSGYSQSYRRIYRPYVGNS